MQMGSGRRWRPADRRVPKLTCEIIATLILGERNHAPSPRVLDRGLMRSAALQLALCGLIGLAAGCTGRSRESVFVNVPGASAEQGSIVRRLRRLSNREYNNVVRDLLWDTTQPANGFLDESYANGYDNGSALLAVQTDQALRYQMAAEQLAENAVQAHLVDLLRGCDPVVSGESQCVDSFLQSFGLRAFRRPPTSGELARLRAVYQSAAEIGGFRTGIQTAIEAILQSPSFVYRRELGGNAAPPNVRRVLDDYELASELSFLIAGTMPDDELLGAASQGRLHAAAELRRQAERLLHTASAKANLREFFHQWLATTLLQGLTKDPLVYPTFNRALARSMATELDLFFDDILWSRSGSLRELFTSQSSFVDAAMSSVYGMDGSADFRPVQLDGHRKGVLTRPGYLAVHSATSHSAPVERGVFFRQALLCTQLPPPPPGVLQMAMMRPLDPTQTTRERFSVHSDDSFCQSCHRLIDLVGFGFEEFDAIGRFRTTENGKPVDSSGTLIGTQDIDGDFNGASELAERLVASRQFRDCAVTQMFRFVTGQAESALDADTISSISNQFSVDRRMTDLLLSFIQTPLFVERSPEKP